MRQTGAPTMSAAYLVVLAGLRVTFRSECLLAFAVPLIQRQAASRRYR
jgi:hypothetical protein